jgi:MFS family permease
MGLVWVGALIGSIIFTLIADKYGRRTTILIAQLLDVTGLLMTLLAPNLLVA